MYAFIGGTPASGKTTTAQEFINVSGLPIELVSIDSLREGFTEDNNLQYWRDFFFNVDEKEYWGNNSYESHMKNIVNQSEAFWPNILECVQKTIKEHEHAIFEAVNILPHLAKKDLSFEGFFMIAEDENQLLDRLQKNPRWGQTEELQNLEAKYFVEWEARWIRNEANKYRYKVFNNKQDATSELSKIFNA